MLSVESFFALRQVRARLCDPRVRDPMGNAGDPKMTPASIFALRAHAGETPAIRTPAILFSSYDLRVESFTNCLTSFCTALSIFLSRFFNSTAPDTRPRQIN